MSTRIIDRGRGPEVEGTRITMYTVMDYYLAGDDPAEIAWEISLTPEQARAAYAYFSEHLDELQPEYELILERVNGKNPEWVEALRPKTVGELKRRIEARRPA